MLAKVERDTVCPTCDEKPFGQRQAAQDQNARSPNPIWTVYSPPPPAEKAQIQDGHARDPIRRGAPASRSTVENFSNMLPSVLLMALVALSASSGSCN